MDLSIQHQEIRVFQVGPVVADDQRVESDCCAMVGKSLTIQNIDESEKEALIVRKLWVK